MQIESPQDIWELVCEELKKKMTDISFNVWIKDLRPIEVRPGQFLLAIYSSYKKGIVESNFLDMIQESIKTVRGVDMEVTIVVEDEFHTQGNIPIATTTNSFESAFTFDNFIVGSTNRFAHAASMAVADNPSTIYNPLVIYGRSGVGKTHLLFAIKNHIAKKFPNKRVEYTRCEDFTNQLISNLQQGRLGLSSMNDFRIASATPMCC